MNTTTATATNFRAGRNATVHAAHKLGKTTRCGAEDTARGHARLTPTTDPVTCKRCLKSLAAA